MSDQHASAHAQHDDDRIEALPEEYGENANLTIDETKLLDAIGREHRH